MKFKTHLLRNPSKTLCGAFARNIPLHYIVTILAATTCGKCRSISDPDGIAARMEEEKNKRTGGLPSGDRD